MYNLRNYVTFKKTILNESFNFYSSKNIELELFLFLVYLKNNRIKYIVYYHQVRIYISGKIYILSSSYPNSMYIREEERFKGTKDILYHFSYKKMISYVTLSEYIYQNRIK